MDLTLLLFLINVYYIAVVLCVTLMVFSVCVYDPVHHLYMSIGRVL